LKQANEFHKHPAAQFLIGLDLAKPADVEWHSMENAEIHL